MLICYFKVTLKDEMENCTERVSDISMKMDMPWISEEEKMS